MFSIANALAVVAAGRMQATLTIEPENEWDLAAGVLLVQESGGSVADARPPIYLQPGDSPIPGCHCGCGNRTSRFASDATDACRPGANEKEAVMTPSLKIALLERFACEAIAERLAAVGHRVVVFNRTQTKAPST